MHAPTSKPPISPGPRLASGLGAELQAYSKLIQGEAALKRHEPKQALSLFTEAQKLVDFWLLHFDMGRA